MLKVAYCLVHRAFFCNDSMSADGRTWYPARELGPLVEATDIPWSTWDERQTGPDFLFIPLPLDQLRGPGAQQGVTQLWRRAGDTIEVRLPGDPATPIWLDCLLTATLVGFLALVLWAAP